MEKEEFKQLEKDERKNLIRLMAKRVCDRYDKAFKLLAEDKKSDLTNKNS